MHANPSISCNKTKIQHLTYYGVVLIAVALMGRAGDYGGPMFLMPGMVIALYTCGKLDQVGQQQQDQ
jgi:hypothetical protein